ncbi:hypothetical protein E3N88_22759 [Mikania micrantha]|uniref:Uncharacterized protein n=1 Tax=Mikania micrantha TaxID=192012 RepID=A0A5N6NDV8_9ASTR|nr:hypothetical protein E3N88_22759 [Mikania micrantha]
MRVEYEAIRRMSSIRRMRADSAELIRPQLPFGRSEGFGNLRSVDFELKSNRIKSQSSDTTLLDRSGARKQSESNRKLLDSLWNSAESYSRVFQSKPTETVVIQGYFTMSQLTGLKVLKLSLCDNLVELPDLPSSLVILNASYCKSLTTIGNCHRNCKWLSHVSLNETNILNGGERLLQSMLEGEAIEHGSMILLLLGVKIPMGFRSPLLRGRRYTLQLPENWLDDFSGYLMCAVSKNFLIWIDFFKISVKQALSGVSSEDEVVWKEVMVIGLHRCGELYISELDILARETQYRLSLTKMTEIISNIGSAYQAATNLAVTQQIQLNCDLVAISRLLNAALFSDRINILRSHQILDDYKHNQVKTVSTQNSKNSNSRKPVPQILSSVRIEINRSLVAIYDIASEKDLKKFISAMWIVKMSK